MKRNEAESIANEIGFADREDIIELIMTKDKPFSDNPHDMNELRVKSEFIEDILCELDSMRKRREDGR